MLHRSFPSPWLRIVQGAKPAWHYVYHLDSVSGRRKWRSSPTSSDKSLSIQATREANRKEAPQPSIFSYRDVPSVQGSRGSLALLVKVVLAALSATSLSDVGLICPISYTRRKHKILGLLARFFHDSLAVSNMELQRKKMPMPHSDCAMGTHPLLYPS